ncbi:MAG: hypothetical protein HC869_09190 [Rhodospirillales bacterium]|nr:hypothetical protein [Rhodospirillales bacterium]
MVTLIIMSTVLIGTLCVLAYRLAVYALPVMLGFEIARLAYQTGAGTIGAGAAGFIAGAVAYGLLSVAFVSLQSPAARIIVGLVFALPAAGAGYAIVSGIGAAAIPSDMWRQMFSVIASLLVGAAAFTRLSAPATTNLA